MDFLQQAFSVRFEYKVFFTNRLFDGNNPIFRDYFKTTGRDGTVRKLLMVLDEGLIAHHPELWERIEEYARGIEQVNLVREPILLPGGEQVKNNEESFYRIIRAVEEHGIDRHSYLAALGGGSVLDAAGYAAAVSHRGIRHIRIPTTVLSQNDSGVGVKNGINFYNKKNFLGTFAPPVAVFNDFDFLQSLSVEEWCSGISEAIKVALIKDPVFFQWLEANAAALSRKTMEPMQYLIRRCAQLHMEHIAGADPFETGSSRPLDFGHWSAHKLEQLTGFSIRHGEAVATGIALDSVYSFLSGRLSGTDLMRILAVLENSGLQITHPLMEVADERSPLIQGLREFREHLGGKLTIMLLREPGKGEEVNEIDTMLVKKSLEWLFAYSSRVLK